MFKRITSYAVLASILLFVYGCSTGEDQYQEQIDNYLNEVFNPAHPGGSVLVAKDGEIIFSKGYGMADVELGVPVNPVMVFAIGSMTKQFTAVSVLKLMEQGKLALSDNILKYLPDFTDYGKVITIEHLLTHTSGIIDLFEIPEWMADWKNDRTPQEITTIFKDRPLLFEPGEQKSYSNAGYVLLGMIIEKVSEKTFAEFVMDNIFNPLNMTNSYEGSYDRIIKNRAKGYIYGQGNFLNAGTFSITHQFGGGSIYSTVEDLLKWNIGLLSGKILKKETLDMAFTPYKLNDGKSANYGYGWEVGNFYGLKMIKHGGSSIGYQGHALLLPEANIYITVLTNSISFNGKSPYTPDPISFKVAKVMLGKPINEEVLTPIEMSNADKEKYIGVYQVSENNYRTITMKSEQLYSQRTGSVKNKIYPLSSTEFFYSGDGKFEFIITDKGDVVEANWRNAAGELSVAKITDIPIPDSKQTILLDSEKLNKFQGEYKTNFIFSFTVEKGDNSLIIKSDGFPTTVFYPEAPNKFFQQDEEEVIIEFLYNEQNEVRGFTMNRYGEIYDLVKVK